MDDTDTTIAPADDPILTFESLGVSPLLVQALADHVHHSRDIGAAIARRLALPGVEALAPEVAAERWGEAKAWFSLGSNSRVRSVRARSELGWAPRHASVIDWILTEMPVDESTASPS